MCDRLNMRFLRPGIGRETLLEQMDIWYRSGDPQGKVIGIFGAAAGIGVTSIAATMAQTMARLGNKVTMLGLNVYHAGWGKDATVSLDRWRQRLISRMLQHEDLQTLIQVNGFRYLPGNDDLLASLDYVEEEIEHLLDVAQQEADVIIADFGAIPESSAWLCGLQRSAIRLMVTHPAYTKRLIALMKLSKHMGVSSEHWHVIGNRIESDQLPLKSIAALHGMLPLLSLPDKGRTSSFALPLNKKEEEQVEEAVRPLLASLGMATSAKRKGGL
jgi:MinD-like ATPase involved in chromosome partitioning or flagellar assembly